MRLNVKRHRPSSGDSEIERLMKKYFGVREGYQKNDKVSVILRHAIYVEYFEDEYGDRKISISLAGTPIIDIEVDKDGRIKSSSVSSPETVIQLIDKAKGGEI